MALVARGAYFVDGAGAPVALPGLDELPAPPPDRDDGGGLPASATWHGADEGYFSDYELSTVEDPPPYGDVDYGCQVERSGQNPPDEDGYSQINNRSIDECTESRDCAPQVHFRESDRTDEEEFIDGAQVGGRSAWLRVLYPDAAAAIDRTLARKDFHWCYFLVWMGDFWDDTERSEGHPGGFLPWEELFPDTVAARSTEATAMVVVAAGVQHFAVYDYAISRRADGLRGIHLRYWVGSTLHPSVWINGNGSLGEQDWSDISEAMRGTVGTRIQAVMMCLLNVSARVVWRPYKYCKTPYVRNQRDYPAGGLGPEASRFLYTKDGRPVVAEETYEQDRDNPDDVSWAAYQQTGGEALSVLGNVVRAQVKFVLADDDARSVEELAEAGFECVFGKRVVTRHTFDYIPNQDPTSNGYRVMARRCLTPHALVHLDDHLADARALVSGDDDKGHPWARLVYQSWDAESMDDDRL